MGRLSTPVFVSAAMLALAGTYPVLAQSASQVTPKATPAKAVGGQSLVFSGGAGLGAPEGAEKLTIKLKDVTVDGGKPELAAAADTLRAALVGRRVAVSDIFAQARELEAAYANAGYILVRVVVPAQSLNDGGTLRLSVVDGFLESIDAENLPPSVKARVVAEVQPLVGRAGVTMPEIERRLLLAGDIPGVGLKTALSPGKTPGGAILVINAELQSISSFVGLDNTLPAGLGTWSATAGVDFNSFLSAGEVIYLRAAGNPVFNGPGDMFGILDDDPRFRSLAAGFIVPIGLDGLTLNLEGTVTQTTPDPVGGLQTSSLFNRLSARVKYPFVRTRQLTVNAGVTFDVQNEYQGLIVGASDIALSEDRLRVIRLTTDASWSPAWGNITSSAVLSLGLDAFGARNAASAVPVPLSRQGADASFTKLEVALGYSHTFAPHFAIDLSARAQTSFGKPLVRSEQFGIANIGELSTFDAGAIVGDSGWVARAEASAPFDLSTSQRSIAVSPYVFGAIGSVHLEQPTIFEAATTNAASIGVGVRLGGAIGTVAPTLTLEYGRAFTDAGFVSDRLTMVSSVHF